jgi:hypothetical protein
MCVTAGSTCGRNKYEVNHEVVECFGVELADQIFIIIFFRAAYVQPPFGVVCNFIDPRGFTPGYLYSSPFGLLQIQLLQGCSGFPAPQNIN